MFEHNLTDPGTMHADEIKLLEKARKKISDPVHQSG